MAKGGKRPGAGRPKGSPNKATADVRAAIALLAERNVAKLENWLNRTAKKNPAKAADLFLRAIEYHIPKLGRVEHTGKDGGDLAIVVQAANHDDAL